MQKFSTYLLCVILVPFFGIVLGLPLAIADPISSNAVRNALEKAVRFFDEQVSVEGSYAWRYTADLSRREGERRIENQGGWVQEPGTPFVGEALLELYRLTGDEIHLQAARRTAMSLVNTQLHSGGWPALIVFDPQERKRYAYRVDGEPSENARNITTLDDDMTQSAFRFLIRYDEASGFSDEPVHETIEYGLTKLLEAQFPNGAWPHVFHGELIDPDKHPVKAADFRDDGNYTRIREHWTLYTINDRLMTDVINTLALAHQVYGENRFLEAIRKAGEFLLLAQLPDPQPGWAQQYDYDMHPAWARRFEPPAITGSESQQVMHSLMDVYLITGDTRFLDPVPRALQYYRDSLLPDGRLARFYELETNRPLYFTQEYELTYQDDDLPTHYAFKVSSQLDRIARRYERIQSEPWKAPVRSVPEVANPSAEDVLSIITAMDERGAWVEDGRMQEWGDDDPATRIIQSRTFVMNAITLASYLHRQ